MCEGLGLRAPPNLGHSIRQRCPPANAFLLRKYVSERELSLCRVRRSTLVDRFRLSSPRDSPPWSEALRVSEAETGAITILILSPRPHRRVVSGVRLLQFALSFQVPVSRLVAHARFASFGAAALISRPVGRRFGRQIDPA